MARTKYRIVLSDEEKELLNRIITEEQSHQREILRANILLMCDENNHPHKTVLEIAEELGTTHTTVQSVKTSYIQFGLEATFTKKKRIISMDNRRINKEAIKQIKILAEGSPPEGHTRWSLRLLCKESVARGIVTHISPATMRTIIQRDNME